MENTKPSNKDHRQGLRERFLNSSLQGFHDSEAIELFTGSLTTSAVYPREVVKKVLKQNAAAIIFVYNHPSGNLGPSQEDIKITKN